MGALNLPSAADLERLTRRVRSLSQRLEGIEDGVDRLDERLAALPVAGIEERLGGIEESLEKLGNEVEALRKKLGAGGAASPPRAARPQRRPRRPPLNKPGPVGSRAGARRGDEGSARPGRGDGSRLEEDARGRQLLSRGFADLGEGAGPDHSGCRCHVVRVALHGGGGSRQASACAAARPAASPAAASASSSQRVPRASRAIATIAPKAIPWRAATAASAPVSRSAASAPAARQASAARRVGRVEQVVGGDDAVAVGAGGQVRRSTGPPSV